MRPSLKRQQKPIVCLLMVIVTIMIAVSSISRKAPKVELQGQSLVNREVLQAFDSNSSNSAPEAAWDTCESYFDQQWYASPFYIIGVLYMFIALAIVSDDYFVESLEFITDKLGVSESVVGATFMAFGSSFPELVTTTIAVFGPESDIGFGTIIGSAIFNLLAIVGLTCSFAGQVLKMDWRPYMRDTTFYSIVVAVLITITWNEKIDWSDALVLNLMFIVYLFIMRFNDRIVACFPAPKHLTKEYTPLLPPDKQEASSSSDEEEEEGEKFLRWFNKPQSVPRWIWFWFIFPIVFAFTFTIPDCRKPMFHKWFMATFLLAVGWIGITAWFMVEWASKAGCILGIDPYAMGIVLVAVGTSIPETVGSYLVARRGKADMSIANALGSNVFDTLMGLGFPWILYTLIYGKSVLVHSEQLVGHAILLLVIMLVVTIILFAVQWTLHKPVGYLLFTLYAGYVTYTLLEIYGLAPPIFTKKKLMML